MRLKPQPFSIDKDDPFKSDKLNRKPEIENLSLLLNKVESPFVMALDSEWGTGKTTFVTLWQELLSKDGFHVLYFNAWKSDFAVDPLIPFLAELNQQIRELSGNNQRINEKLDRVKAIGAHIARRGAPVLLRLLTGGLLDASPETLGQLSNLAGKLGEDAIDAYDATKSDVSDFRKALEELLRETSASHPVIVFVDELDRCRPDYGIRLLERIKHLFDVDGLIFVISVDNKQLSNAIKAIYGSDFDASGYLRRFIDFHCCPAISPTGSVG